MDIQKVFMSGTPLNPTPQNIVNRRLPPSTLPIKYKLNSGMFKAPIRSKYQTTPLQPLVSSNIEINSPKLPIVCIRSNKTPQFKARSIKYSKFSPKICEFKPILHQRTRSYNIVGDDCDEFRTIKRKIPLLDY